MKKWTNKWLSPVRVILTGVGVGALALLVPMVVSAVAPPANTNIGNKASATYRDAAGQSQFVQSNQVSTTVAQTGAITLTNSNTKSTAVGNTVYMPHTLTNTGNGTDIFKITVTDNLVTAGGFTSISIYADESGTGQPSSPTPLCTTPGANPCNGAGIQKSLSANSSFSFVVAYQVPSTATAPATPFDTATVTAVPTSTGIPYSPTSVSNTDTVNLTTGAAFSATKSRSAPAVQAAPSGNWPEIVTSGKPSAASCSTTWPVSTTTSPLCTYTVYTINFSNGGAAVGAFSMEDSIPSGMTYVKGSAVWSGNGGVAMSDTATLTQTGTGTGAIKSSFVGTKFTAIVPSVNPGVSGTISFVVLINSTATVGTGSTRNIADFFTTSCDLSQTINAGNCNNTTTPPSHTNPSPFPITQTYGVVAASEVSTTPDTATPPAQSGINLVEKASVAPGGSVDFINFVTNTGNDSDVFNLTTSNSNFPAGTSFQFFKGDGVTPWLDTNSDNIPDTGSIEPGTANAVIVILKATILNTTPAGNTPFLVLTTATSVGNGPVLPLVKDSVWNKVLSVVPTVIRVDLTNTTGGNRTIVNGTETGACTAGVNCDLGAGPSSGPTDTETTTPGVGVLFPLFIKNNESTNGTYALTAPSLPVGWNVKYVASGGTCASDAISPTVSVTANSQVKVMACVTPPNGAPEGTSNVYFKVTSTGADQSITDTITDGVTITRLNIKQLSLTPEDGSNTITGGGTVVQPAVLTNSGNQNCGTTNGFNVTVTLDPASVAAQWSATVYYDLPTIGTIESGDKLLGAPTTTGAGNFNSTVDSALIPLLPGKNIPLLVKFFAPSGAVNGAVATATLTVVDRSADQCPTQFSTFRATVANGLLRIQKLQALDTGCTGSALDSAFTESQLQIEPNQCLIYRVIATNDGSAAVNSVVINDAAPSFTTYVATPSTASTCVVSGGTGATPAFAATAAGLVSCSGGSAPGVILNPLGKMTMQFPVRVQN